MLQAIIKKGKVIAEEVPAPNVSKGSVLIKVVNSSISAGTELSNVDVTKGSLIKLALKQPENVKMALDILKANGLKRTIAKINSQREGGKSTGYSISGIALAVGEGVENIKPGDHVAAAGHGMANHAEYVDVPVNLVMKMPKDLSFKEASSVAIGGIALQGVRRADLKIGEFCVVIGAGIIGLITVQILMASGIRVIAIDINEERLQLAKKYGAELIINPLNEDAVSKVENYTGGVGTDCVIFTAATADDKPLSDAFKMCKRKGKVILVGVAGKEIDRNDIYPKEIDFLVSTSYGPGRYDVSYEEDGNDYPIAYVRWTENRNMTEYLRLLKERRVDLSLMINKEFSIENVTEAFDSLNSEEKPLMVILNYGKETIHEIPETDRKINISVKKVTDKKKFNIALAGAGNFAVSMHLPNLKSLSKYYNIYCVFDEKGHSAKVAAKQYKANYATSNYNDLLSDNEVDVILISTRHDSHAQFVLSALEAGKHVFVEKPLATTLEDLNKMKEFYKDGIKGKPILFTGYNRRFSKYASAIKKETANRINPLFISYRMNAGFIPLDHWVHKDGGRMVGEACHLIDLMTYFTESKIKNLSVDSITPTNDKYIDADNKSILLKYTDGSVCNIHYFAVGNKKLEKEYMEVHFDNKSFILNDYCKLKGFGTRLGNISSAISQKGHKEELIELYKSISGQKENWPIELWDMMQTAELSFII